MELSDGGGKKLNLLQQLVQHLQLVHFLPAVMHAQPLPFVALIPCLHSEFLPQLQQLLTVDAWVLCLCGGGSVVSLLVGRVRRIVASVRAVACARVVSIATVVVVRDVVGWTVPNPAPVARGTEAT